jgi:transcriptional regulator with XRE-family HTH domain
MDQTSSLDLPIGERVRYYRERRGLNQLSLGAMVGRSEDWVSKVERGILPVDRYSMLIELARALSVRDLVDLTGHPLAVSSSETPEHASVAEIRAAMTRLPALRGNTLPGSPLGAEALAERVSAAWTIYDTDTARYARLGPGLPDLLGEAYRSTRAAGPGAEAAARSRIEVYHLLQVFLKRLGERELARTAADRALTYASELGDPVWMGASAWNLGAIMLNRGEGDLALDLVREMIGMMTPIPEDASAEYISVYGALHLVAVIASARSGQSSRGWDYLRQADTVAQRLGADRNDFRTSFGPTNVKMHSVHLAGEDGDPTEALRLADDVEIVPGILPLERTTRYLVEVMQANRLVKDDLGTLYMLQRIEAQSPEEIKFFPVAREAVRDLVHKNKSLYRRDVRAMADRLGVAV